MANFAGVFGSSEESESGRVPRAVRKAAIAARPWASMGAGVSEGSVVCAEEIVARRQMMVVIAETRVVFVAFEMLIPSNPFG